MSDKVTNDAVKEIATLNEGVLIGVSRELGFEPTELEAFRDFVNNALLSRAELLTRYIDPRRDYNFECGYPRKITSQQYKDMYEREPISARVVECIVSESWKVTPEVYENEDIEVTTPFEQAWKEVSDSLRGDNWLQDEIGNPIWDYLRRADELSRIGHYGIILIGIDDGEELETPVKLGAGDKRHKVTYLRVFDDKSADIIRVDTDPKSPRYGMPLMYNLHFNNWEDLLDVDDIATNTNTKQVHFSRVIHLAEHLKSNEVYGVPAMRPVFNRLLDLTKLYGGSAEMYWRGAFPGLTLEIDPEVSQELDLDATKGQITKYFNGLQRYLAVVGGRFTTLAPQVSDPTAQIEVHLQAICIQLGIPKRIFMGSERGELSSGQDSDEWKDRVRSRQTNYLTPNVVARFVNRLIMMGVLPKPKGFTVYWPPLENVNDEKKAAVANARIDALSKYVQSSAHPMLTPLDFYVRFLGLTEDEAKSLLESAADDKEDDNQLIPPGGVEGAIQLFTMAAQGQLEESALRELLMLFYGLDEEKVDAILVDGIPEPPEPPTPVSPPGTPPSGNPNNPVPNKGKVPPNNKKPNEPVAK